MSEPTAGDGEPALRRFLATGLVWSGGGLAVAVAMAFAVNALAARLLTVEGLAAFLLLVSIGQSFGSAAELGLPPLVVRALSEDPEQEGPRFLGHAWVLVAVAVLAITALGAVAGRPVAAWATEQPAVVELAPWVGALIAVRALERLAGDSYRGLRDIPRAVVYGNVAWQLAGAVLLGVLLLLGLRQLPHLAVGGYAAAGLAGALLAAFGLRRTWPRRPWTALGGAAGPMLRESWPLIGHRSMFLVLQQAPLWVVGALLAAAPTADYGLAQRVVTVIGFPLLMVNQVVPPLINRGAVHHPQRLERTLRTTATLAAIPAAAVLLSLVVFGVPIISIAFGQTYVGAATPLAILSIGQLTNVLAGSCGPVLTQTGHQRVLWRITVSVTIGTVAAAALAARPFGVVGVATASTLGLVVQNLAMVWAAHRLVGIRTWVGRAGLSTLGDELRRLRTQLAARRG